MTKPEVSELLAVIRMLWPHSTLGDDPKAVIVVWHSMLINANASEVEGAVRELAQSGREHAPPVGVIVNLLAKRQTAAPDWDEVEAEIVRALYRYRPPKGTVLRFESDLHAPPPAEYFSHSLIAQFAIPAWHEWRLVKDRDRRTFLAQQREAWKAMRSRSERDRGLGLVSAPRRHGELRPMREITEGGG